MNLYFYDFAYPFSLQILVVSLLLPQRVEALRGSKHPPNTQDHSLCPPRVRLVEALLEVGSLSNIRGSFPCDSTIPTTGIHPQERKLAYKRDTWKVRDKCTWCCIIHNNQNTGINGSAHAQMNGKRNLRYPQWNIIHHEQEWKLTICSRMVRPRGQRGQNGQNYILSFIHVNLKKKKDLKVR